MINVSDERDSGRKKGKRMETPISVSKKNYVRRVGASRRRRGGVSEFGIKSESFYCSCWFVFRDLSHEMGD